MERRIKMSNNIVKYLVKLTPVGKFFFGGDATFKVGTENSKDYDEAYSSYIIRSFKMPQQTSLLGMMRFLLLSNSDCFDRNKNQIKDVNDPKLSALIGEQSFAVNEAGDFGCISEIGPCFVMDKTDNAFFCAPMDADLLVDFKKPVDAVVNGENVKLPDITKKIKTNDDNHFSGKDYLPERFMAADGTLADKDLFIEDVRVGINRNYTGKTEKEAFYKQISYRLSEGYCFAFEVSVNGCIDLSHYNNQVVQLGADSSSFVFEAKPLSVDISYPATDKEKVVLLSDTYIAKPDAKYAFSITKTRPFRFLKTTNSADRSAYNVKYKSLRCEERYELFCAGSVFYFSNEEQRSKFCESISNTAEFVKIGYNRYY